MTGFNNNNNIKFVPSTPKTFQVLELRDQQQQQPVKKSPLSAAARSKVINRSGSNYLSESKEYGPCHNCEDEKKKLKFELVIILKNCTGGEKGGTVCSTSEAYRAAREIRDSEGHWKGNLNTGAFSSSNRNILANWIIAEIDNHKNGNSVNKTLSVGGDD